MKVRNLPVAPAGPGCCQRERLGHTFRQILLVLSRTCRVWREFPLEDTPWGQWGLSGAQLGLLVWVEGKAAGPPGRLCCRGWSPGQGGHWKVLRLICWPSTQSPGPHVADFVLQNEVKAETAGSRSLGALNWPRPLALPPGWGMTTVGGIS